MIFVTVGTIFFDDLVRFIDESVAAGLIIDPVVMQIGFGEYLPRHCEYYRIAPDLAPYYEQADLVIAHGGTGTTLEVLAHELPLVSICNPALADNHQHEFLSAMSELGVVNYCRRFEEIIPAINRLRERLHHYVRFDEQLIRSRLVAELDGLASLPSVPSSKPGLLRSLAQRIVRPIHDDQFMSAHRNGSR